MSRIRLVPMILVAIVSLAVLFGGWQFYQHYSVVSPLQTDLQSISGVKSSNVQPGNPSTIEVTLGSVTDLQTTYKDILKKAKVEMHGPVALDVSGNTNKELNQVYEDITPTLMEGVAKGNFTEMIKNVTRVAQKQGVKTKITMDATDIFIQMSKGKNHLYAVLPYSLQRGGAVS